MPYLAAESSMEEKYSVAVKSLDSAYVLSQDIKNECSRFTVSSEIDVCRSDVKKYFLSKNYQAMTGRIASLYENIDEILSECDQDDIVREITDCVIIAADCSDY